MKKYLFATAALAALLSTNVLAETAEAQQEALAAECKKAAMEEDIPDEELASYIEQCIQDSAAAESGSETEEPDSESDKE